MPMQMEKPPRACTNATNAALYYNLMMHTMKRHKSVEGAKILLVMSQRVQRPSWRDIEAKQRTGWQQKYVLLILPAHVTRFSE